MIKTLRITSVAAVLLAVVVLASVLGYLRPAALIHLRLAVRGDKQIDSILGGTSAVERFKTQYGSKVAGGEDTTPPLVKQADLFANIINPPADTAAKLSGQMPPRQKASPIPPVAVSGKFDLLGTCYSPDPKSSYAYIRLPDNTYQWVGVGSEIGRVTVKEIRKGSILYWDGKSNVEMSTQATPETSTMLETGKAPAMPALSVPRSTATGKAPSGPGKATLKATGRSSDSKAFVTPNRPAVPASPTPAAEISKEEQENLSQLGDRLKTGASADSGEADKLISEYKSAQAPAPNAEKPANPGVQPNANKDVLKSSSDETRFQYKKKFTIPRSMKK